VGTLYFDGDSKSCAATPAGLPKFYARGSDLATELQNAMNGAASCGTNYAVAYDPANGRFRFSRASGSFSIRWGQTPNNIRNALARKSTSTQNCSCTTDAPWTALYRGTGPSTLTSGTADDVGGEFGTVDKGMHTPWTIVEPINGIDTTFHQIATSRLFNGETIRVTPTGEACG
jgi:hypothetical protein